MSDLVYDSKCSLKKPVIYSGTVHNERLHFGTILSTKTFVQLVKFVCKILIWYLSTQSNVQALKILLFISKRTDIVLTTHLTCFTVSQQPSVSVILAKRAARLARTDPERATDWRLTEPRTNRCRALCSRRYQRSFPPVAHCTLPC